jgi:hypothetical protein
MSSACVNSSSARSCGGGRAATISRTQSAPTRLASTICAFSRMKSLHSSGSVTVWRTAAQVVEAAAEVAVGQDAHAGRAAGRVQRGDVARVGVLAQRAGARRGALELGDDRRARALAQRRDEVPRARQAGPELEQLAVRQRRGACRPGARQLGALGREDLVEERRPCPSWCPSMPQARPLRGSPGPTRPRRRLHATSEPARGGRCRRRAPRRCGPPAPAAPRARRPPPPAGPAPRCTAQTCGRARSRRRGGGAAPRRCRPDPRPRGRRSGVARRPACSGRSTWRCTPPAPTRAPGSRPRGSGRRCPGSPLGRSDPARKPWTTNTRSLPSSPSARPSPAQRRGSNTPITWRRTPRGWSSARRG